MLDGGMKIAEDIDQGKMTGQGGTPPEILIDGPVIGALHQEIAVAMESPRKGEGLQRGKSTQKGILSVMEQGILVIEGMEQGPAHVDETNIGTDHLLEAEARIQVALDLGSFQEDSLILAGVLLRLLQTYLEDRNKTVQEGNLTCQLHNVQQTPKKLAHLII